jgi:predicted RNA-binding protein YlxR (DUF448 family)
MRRCVGCYEMKPKRELTRVVRSPAGEFSIDKTGKANGRGAYVCPNPECFQKLRKKKALNHAFRCNIPEEVYMALEGELA